MSPPRGRLTAHSEPRYKTMIVTELAEVHLCVPEPAAAALAGFLVDQIGAGFEQRDGDTLATSAAGVIEFVVWVPSDSVGARIGAVNRFMDSLREMGTTVDPFTWHQGQ